MEQSGEQTIPASREAVWLALNDDEVLGACIPGCDNIERVSDTEFKAAVRAKIGPVSAKFDADIQIEDAKPPERYALRVAVKGGAAGFGSGTAQVNLDEQDANTTVLRYSANAKVGGKLAQVGSRLVDGAARKMANDFFGAFCERLGGNPDDGQPAASEQAVAAGEARYQPTQQWAVWLVVFAIFVAAMILAY